METNRKMKKINLTNIGEMLKAFVSRGPEGTGYFDANAPWH